MCWMWWAAYSTSMEHCLRQLRNRRISPSGRKALENSPQVWSCATTGSHARWSYGRARSGAVRVYHYHFRPPMLQHLEQGFPVHSGRLHWQQCCPALRQPMGPPVQPRRVAGTLTPGAPSVFRNRHEAAAGAYSIPAACKFTWDNPAGRDCRPTTTAVPGPTGQRFGSPGASPHLDQPRRRLPNRSGRYGAAGRRQR